MVLLFKAGLSREDQQFGVLLHCTVCVNMSNGFGDMFEVNAINLKYYCIMYAILGVFLLLLQILYNMCLFLAFLYTVSGNYSTAVGMCIGGKGLLIKLGCENLIFRIRNASQLQKTKQPSKLHCKVFLLISITIKLLCLMFVYVCFMFAKWLVL